MPKRWSFLRLLIPLHLLLFTSIEFAASRTVYTIIDDTNGDEQTKVKPTYFPSTGVWDDNTCGDAQGCAIVPDAALAYQGTWTAATYRPKAVSGDKISVLFGFQGTGISIFLILANDLGRPWVTTLTECNFTLDGQLMKEYRHAPTSQSGLQYREEAFTVSGLSNSSHLVEISAGGLGYEVFLNFDYANYTYEIPDSASNLPSSLPESSSSTGAIVGGVVGGVLALLAIIALAVFLVCRKRRTRATPVSVDPAITPFFVSSDEAESGIRQPQFIPYSTTLKSQSHSSAPSSSSSANEKYSAERAELRRLRDELRHLQGSRTQNPAPSIPDSGLDTNVAELREEMRRIQEQLDALRHDSGPPPVYTS
ncbi:hypothetical protein VNI00_012887 [Paramarasmius palmivorus]|uniref:Uncharacterized protein n=1 Tax=Paramarasmius palmivorus TaxID=297713 RepID=A0AAW0BZG5_9AGAR